ncbi:MAG: hypothetical protein IJ501_03545 [Bacilli bacterium]|nr:hypothetical protein [Bacilli bacterium]
MMISPDLYRDEKQTKTYEELIKEKDKLVKYIRDFEINKIPMDDYLMNPSPEVLYKCNLEYLSELCILIKEKFNKKLWEGYDE